MEIGRPGIIQFQDRSSQGGILYIAEQMRDVPFRIKRVFWLSQIPEGGIRGGHAHRKCCEVIVALQGVFHVTVVKNGRSQEWTLFRSSEGLYIPKGYYVKVHSFSFEAICLVLASELYNEEDKIHDAS